MISKEGVNELSSLLEDIQNIAPEREEDGSYMPFHTKNSFVERMSKVSAYCLFFFILRLTNIKLVSKVFVRTNIFSTILLLQKSLAYEIQIIRNTPTQYGQELKLKRASTRIHKKMQPKIYRSYITEEAKKKLEISFKTNNYPGQKSIARISEDCQMTSDKVRAWFANRRYRKKNLKKYG